MATLTDLMIYVRGAKEQIDDISKTINDLTKMIDDCLEGMVKYSEYKIGDIITPCEYDNLKQNDLKITDVKCHLNPKTNKFEYTYFCETIEPPIIKKCVLIIDVLTRKVITLSPIYDDIDDIYFK
jgi:hypothetical protein